MIDFEEFYDHAGRTRLKPWVYHFRKEIEQAMQPGRHGDFEKWLDALELLPNISTCSRYPDRDRVTVGTIEDCDDAVRDKLKDALKLLHPWRKGPFELFGIHIDTEWRSDWKWRRVQPHITPLKGRKVLDIGCGSGYHLWRMLGEGAGMVIGVDPSLLFLCQFYAIKHYMGKTPVYMLPLGIEHLPKKMHAFDTVFSMGILYHRRSPLDHLFELRELLVSGGELVLETLVIEGGETSVLVPEGRYARMGNIWFLPSVAALQVWLKKCGFLNVQVVDVSETTTDEQRPTEWMTFQSLPHFLDPNDASRTLEGYPAPVRATLIAQAP